MDYGEPITPAEVCEYLADQIKYRVQRLRAEGDEKYARASELESAMWDVVEKEARSFDQWKTPGATPGTDE